MLTHNDILLFYDNYGLVSFHSIQDQVAKVLLYNYDNIVLHLKQPMLEIWKSCAYS